MKAALLLLFICATAFCQESVNLDWDRSPSGTNVTGYNIYYGPASGSYTNEISFGNVTNCTISGLVQGGVYYFAATSYDSFGDESPFSNELEYQVPFLLEAPLLTTVNIAIPQPYWLTNTNGSISLTCMVMNTSYVITNGSWSSEANMVLMSTNQQAAVNLRFGSLSIKSLSKGVIDITVPASFDFTYTNVASYSNKFFRLGTNAP